MAEISKQAGMSAGHIYNYFDSKDAIILAFVEREAEHVAGLLRDLDSRDDPLEAMLEDAPMHVAESLDPQPWHMPLEMYSEASRNPVIAPSSRKSTSAPITSYVNWSGVAASSASCRWTIPARWPAEYAGDVFPRPARARHPAAGHEPRGAGGGIRCAMRALLLS
jgi:AcrR family transcriptional regulator